MSGSPKSSPMFACVSTGCSKFQPTSQAMKPLITKGFEMPLRDAEKQPETDWVLLRIRRFQVQLLMGAPLLQPLTQDSSTGNSSRSIKRSNMAQNLASCRRRFEWCPAGRLATSPEPLIVSRPPRRAELPCARRLKPLSTSDPKNTEVSFSPRPRTETRGRNPFLAGAGSP